MLTPEAKVEWIAKARAMIDEASAEVMQYLNNQLAVEGFKMDQTIIITIEFKPIALKESDAKFLRSIGVRT